LNLFEEGSRIKYREEEGKWGELKVRRLGIRKGALQLSGLEG